LDFTAKGGKRQGHAVPQSLRFGKPNKSFMATAFRINVCSRQTEAQGFIRLFLSMFTGCFGFAKLNLYIKPLEQCN